MTTALTENQQQENNYKMFYETIKGLSTSQGFYSRLARNIDDLTDNEIDELKQQLPNFNDSLDVVLWLEG